MPYYLKVTKDTIQWLDNIVVPEGWLPERLLSMQEM